MATYELLGLNESTPKAVAPTESDRGEVVGSFLTGGTTKFQYLTGTGNSLTNYTPDSIAVGDLFEVSAYSSSSTKYPATWKCTSIAASLPSGATAGDVNNQSGLKLYILNSGSDYYEFERVSGGNPIENILGHGPYVIACTGQSSAVGRAGGSIPAANSAIKMFDITSGEFVTADFENDTYTLDMGSGDEAGNGDNNIGLCFCNWLHDQTGADVYYILNAKGGESITQWVSGNFTTTLKSTISTALASSLAPTKQTIDVFIWLQGEKDLDNEMSYDDYASNFESFVGLMDSESYFDIESTPIITAPISRDYIVNNEIIKFDVQDFFNDVASGNTSTYGRTCLASVNNLPLADVAHYTGASQYELGYNRMPYTLLNIDRQGKESGVPRVQPSITAFDNLGDDNIIGGRASAEDYDSSTWGEGNTGYGKSTFRFVANTGDNNVAYGESQGRGYLTLGDNNTLMGFTDVDDLASSSSATKVMGDSNTVIGSRCLPEATTANANTFIGFACGLGVSSVGSSNVVLGDKAGRAGTIATGNVIFGLSPVSDDLTSIGSNNVVIGTEALGGSATSGTLGTDDTRHVAIGAYAASYLNTSSGANNGVTCVGGLAGRKMQDTSDMTSAQNVTCLGYGAAVSGNNQVQLGNSSTTTYAYGAVQDRSDKRDKTDFRPIPSEMFDFFMDVEFTQYRLDYRESYYDQCEGEGGKPEIKVLEKDGSRAGKRHHNGAIAQQVEEAMNKHGVDFAGLQHHEKNGGCDVYSLGYQEFIPIIGELVQRHEKDMKALLDRVKKLESEK